MSASSAAAARGVCPRRIPPAIRLVALPLCTLSMSPPALAATPDGAALSAWWGVPFAGMLLSIALFPMFAGRFWHHHFGKIAAAWALLFLLPFGAAFGGSAALGVFVHALLEEYVPFILLLTALYTVAGGICVRGDLRGSPRTNTAILAFGTMVAPSLKAAEEFDATVANMRFVKPLDAELVRKLAETHDYLVTVEEGCIMGGAGSACWPPRAIASTRWRWTAGSRAASPSTTRCRACWISAAPASLVR